MGFRFADHATAMVAIASFTLGACVTVAATSAAAPTATEKSTKDQRSSSCGAGEAEKAARTSVIALADAPEQVAPSGKAKIRHLARGENAYLGHLEMQAGAAVPEHRDATEEYIHVLEGTGTLTIDDQSYELKPGTTVFMPANAKVSYQNGDEKMVAIQVFAGPGPSAKYEGWNSPAP